MLQDETIMKDQVTSTASQELERRNEPETQKESRSELRITKESALSTTTSTTGSSGSGNRKSGRLTMTVEKFDPSPGLKTPRIMTHPKVPSVPKTLMNTGSWIVKTRVKIRIENDLQGSEIQNVISTLLNRSVTPWGRHHSALQIRSNHYEDSTTNHYI